MHTEELDYVIEVPENVSHFSNQNEISELIKIQGLIKSNEELISRIKQ